ncbi:YadA family autotransporter adhesin, partial [Paraburkholderia sp. J63]|uniref:YadA family autotransporter adhesin n=1 Tax=Paraburkholderia sp. J63 TaxID=2805434 RepID=UPI002ABDB64F
STFASATNSMALGQSANVDAQAANSIAFGKGAKVTSAAPGSVALGASSVADRANSVSVGSASNQRQVVYVAAGTASTDAVNVSQLTSAVSAFGGNATVGADGSIVNPSYTIDGKTYHNVGDAIAALGDGGGGGNDPLAVHYDDSSMTSVTLGGADSTTPVALHNVANATLNNDAVNLAQLEAMGATVDTSGNVTNAFVAYDDTSKGSVTLGGVGSTMPVKLGNVADGAVNVSSTDAVNGSQLYGLASSTASALGGKTTVNPDGTISLPNYSLSGSTYSTVESALEALDAKASTGSVDGVKYDTSAHDQVTFGGTNATVQVKLTNVASGTVSASSSDAVNGAQLYALGATTDTSGNITNAFVAYDDTSKTRITLGAAGATTPVALTNVANGALNAASTDAVNGQQLFATNQSISDLSGAVTNIAGDVTNLYGKVADAVLYDTSVHDSVTFGGTGAAPVALHNVANGVVSQASNDAVNGSQLYGLASSTATALGGQTTVNSNGTITAPTYVVAGSSYYDVGSAIAAVTAYAGGGSVDAVMYDTSMHNQITLGGQNSTVGPVLLTNVASGTVSASSSDAVNGAQLYALGATTDTSGNITNAFVAYDNTSKSSVTFGGVGSTSGVVLHNVAAGAQDLDAVNVAQLKAAGLNVDTSGNVLNAFVAYDDTSKSSITLGGIGSTTPVALHNVANGVTANDAVNVAQLQAMGANVDSSGNVTNSFVAYDDSTKSSVTFGGLGATAPVMLHNVGAGVVSASSTDAVNGAQLYNVASSTASSLGGGSTVQADGSISAPSYAIGGNTYNNVGGALTNLDGRVTNIENTVTNIAGAVANAVQYDSSAHDKITLGGTDASTAVALTNVANGALNASSTDAVNGSQLYATNVEVSNLNQAIQNININGSEYMSTNSTSGPASATGTNSIAAGGGAIASGANSTAIGDKASATGNNSVALGANSVADEDNTVSVGSQGNERRITNVANGINPTDAANVGQLQSGLNALQGNVNSVARNAYGGVAAATALTMIPDVDQNKTIAVGVGTANFQGYQAVALGASARITQNLKVKLGGGYASGGGATYGGGMSYQW